MDSTVQSYRTGIDSMRRVGGIKPGLADLPLQHGEIENIFTLGLSEKSRETAKQKPFYSKTQPNRRMAVANAENFP